MGRIVTIKDVAAKAYVSASTVSYVINNKPNISDEVKRRVMQAVEELGYRPNRAARNLVSNCAGQIGLYATSLEFLKHSIFFSEIAASILEECSGTIYNLVVKASDNQDGFWADLPSGEVDGAILICPTGDEEYAQRIISSGIPIVLIGRPGTNAELINYVDNDNVSISYHMTKYLLQLGHKRIGLLAGPGNYTVSLDRELGYKMALKEAQIEINPQYIQFSNYGIIDEMQFVKNAILADGVTALLTADDTLAVSAVNTVFACGLSVPGDISVVCLSETYFSQNYRPKITGVYPNSSKLGRIASRKLIDLIDKRLIRPSPSIVDYTVNIRESCLQKPK